MENMTSVFMKIWIQPSLENNYSVGYIHVVHKLLKNITSCCLRVRARWRCIIWKHWQKPFWYLNSLKKEEWPLLRSYIKVQFKQTLWSSDLLTWNLKWSILYCPMLCRRTYRGLCHFKLSILPYYYFIISLYRSLNSNAVISVDDVSLKGKSTHDIYWNAIIAVTHIYRFSPMGFLWLRVSLTNAHSPQPLTPSHFLSHTHSPPFVFTQHRYRSSQRAQVYFPLHGGCKHWKHKLCLREEVGETTEDALCRRHNGERITMASCRASGTQRGITASGT